MNGRSGNVDLARFIGSLLIMTHHIKFLGFTDYIFSDSWIYVEFFLIITGYYTVKHFDGKNYENPMKEGIIYTLKKFIPYLPYTITTTVLMYILVMAPKLISGQLNMKGFLVSFTDNFIFDLLLVSDSYTVPVLGTLWYLSALFIIFPLFSWFIQISNRYWIMSITSIYTLVYYGRYSVKSPCLQAYPRVLAGLCIGVFIYEFVYAFNDYVSKVNKMLLTIIEIATFSFPIVSNYKNWGGSRQDLFCFALR